MVYSVQFVSEILMSVFYIHLCKYKQLFIMSTTNSKAAIIYTCLALFLISCASEQLLQDLTSQKLLFKRNIYARPSQAVTLIRLDSSTQSTKSFKLLNGTSQIKNADSPFYLINHVSSTNQYFSAQAQWNDYNTIRGVRGMVVDRTTYYIRSQFLLNETHHIVSNNFQPTSSEFECKYLYISTLTPSRTNTIKFALGSHDINYKLVGSFQNWTMSPSQNLKIIPVQNYEQTKFWVLETQVENPTQYDISYQIKCKSEYEHNCGNGLLQGLQKCDNGNKQGCTNCTIDRGYACTGNPGGISLCSTKCGDGILAGTQKCDTKNASNTGCINCQIVAGYSCTSVPLQTSVCRVVCGDGIKAGNQTCDNGNQEGCINCVQDIYYVCTGAVGQKSVCKPICGDKYLSPGEACDNGNLVGCLNCQVGKGFTCTSQLGQTSTCQAICGDGMRYGSQQCDNFNKTGCVNCRKVSGYSCTGNVGQVSTCVPVCGDYIKVPEEQCDNGVGRKGCTNCKIDAGYKCILYPSSPTSVCSLK